MKSSNAENITFPWYSSAWASIEGQFQSNSESTDRVYLDGPTIFHNPWVLQNFCLTVSFFLVFMCVLQCILYFFTKLSCSLFWRFFARLKHLKFWSCNWTSQNVLDSERKIQVLSPHQVLHLSYTTPSIMIKFIITKSIVTRSFALVNLQLKLLNSE